MARMTHMNYKVDKEAKEIYMLTGMEEYLKRHPKERADYERFLEKGKTTLLSFYPIGCLIKVFIYSISPLKESMSRN